jgi:hypothetical protein
MKRIRALVAAVACVSAIAATTVAVASADPSNSTTWTSTGCTGPAGTPTTFDAVRLLFTIPTGNITGQTQPIWQLADGTGTFQAFSGMNLDTGSSFSAHGLDGLLTVTCYTTSPVSGYHYVFTGFLTPVGAH